MSDKQSLWSEAESHAASLHCLRSSEPAQAYKCVLKPYSAMLLASGFHNEPHHPPEGTHFRRLYLQSLSFGLYSKLVHIDEGWNVDPLVNLSQLFHYSTEMQCNTLLMFVRSLAVLLVSI